MKFNAFAILVVVIGLFISRDKLVSVLHWETTPTDFFKEGQCKGKKLCGVAYLVPKSHATNEILPELQKYMERAKKHPEYGIQVIVGRGKTSEENTEKAKKVGEGVIVDQDDILGMEYAIVDPPSFFVIDPLNETKLVGKAAWGWFRASFSH
jgi:hypothetical protein